MQQRKNSEKPIPIKRLIYNEIEIKIILNEKQPIIYKPEDQ